MHNDLRKPHWLNKKIDFLARQKMDKLLKHNELSTICQEAKCPNISECFAKQQATFLILGSICTRRCSYCNVATGKALDVDVNEPIRVAKAVEKLKLKHVVITSPSRDDLADGGALQFVNVVQEIKKNITKTDIELLIPDFKEQQDSLSMVAHSGARIIGHNLETVPRLYRIRKASSYTRSLRVLEKLASYGVTTKSGIMVGLGETSKEVKLLLSNLINVGCKLISIGQYLAPSHAHEKVKEYITPNTFKNYENMAYELGFNAVKSGPYVRSSYMADEYIN